MPMAQSAAQSTAHDAGPSPEVDQLAEQPDPLLVLGTEAPVVVGDEVDLGEAVAEQEDGIDVDVADAGPEVEGVAGGAHRLALDHRVAPPHVDDRRKA